MEPHAPHSPDREQDRDSSRVAVVVAGAGARGAYEAGVLSVVVPFLRAAGDTPDLFIGTSAGAINATLFAAGAHLPADEQADAALSVWRSVKIDDVFRPRWGHGSTRRESGGYARVVRGKWERFERVRMRYQIVRFRRGGWHGRR
jgi:predicted acylesterase/phospholipase RssA